jgi:hypothetical protein
LTGLLITAKYLDKEMKIPDAIENDIADSIKAQMQAVEEWHIREPKDNDLQYIAGSRGELCKLVLKQHLMNFRLWHIEDIARRTDVDTSVIVDCKHRIDALNQLRTEAFEAVDAYLVNCLINIAPPLVGVRVRHNTESLGMVIDRLSILALKIFHMAEQEKRKNTDEAHKKNCAGKLVVLKEQHKDLVQALFDLIEDFYTGIKQPKLYYQFKMYNDPSLNPQLYETITIKA